MHGAATNAFAAIVRAKRERILAAGDALVFPVKLVRTGLVTDPIALGIPKRSGFHAQHLEAGASQPLEQHAARRPDADDHIIHFLARRMAMHRKVDALHRPEAMDVIVGR